MSITATVIKLLHAQALVHIPHGRGDDRGGGGGGGPARAARGDGELPGREDHWGEGGGRGGGRS